MYAPCCQEESAWPLTIGHGMVVYRLLPWLPLLMRLLLQLLLLMLLILLLLLVVVVAAAAVAEAVGSAVAAVGRGGGGCRVWVMGCHYGSNLLLGGGSLMTPRKKNCATMGPYRSLTPRGQTNALHSIAHSLGSCFSRCP